MFRLLGLCVCLMVGCKSFDYTYWEDIPESERERIIESDEFNRKISQIPMLSDEDDNDALLLRVTGADVGDEILPFYFYTFNRWVVKSDGAVAEVMSPYIRNMILNHPDYSLVYFKSDPQLMETYILLLAVEFILIDSKGERDNSCGEFCLILKDKMEDFTRNEQIYRVFCKKLIDKINELMMVGFTAPSVYTYWEDIPESERAWVIESDEFNRKISQIPMLSDEDEDDNDALLLRVTGADVGDEILPFYFYTFNRWVVKSDGAVAEVMSPYIRNMILNHPDYSLVYFKSHPQLMETYIILLIDEFIFIDSKEERENAYREFCRKLKDKMEDFTRNEQIYRVFCKKLIDKVNEFV